MQRLARRARSVGLLGLAVMTLLASSGCNVTAEAYTSYQLLQRERGAHGRSALVLDARLAAKAQQWADVLAASGQTRHSQLADGVGTGWHRLAENVGVAASVGEMHRVFMASGVHRATLLDGRMTHVGTGVAWRSGRAYVVHVFGG